MSIIEEVKKMRSEGKSEQEIGQVLKQRGVSDREIDAAISQAQIKEAVSNVGMSEQQNSETPSIPDVGGFAERAYQYSNREQVAQDYAQQEQYSGMQPSISSEEQQQYSTEYPGLGTEQYPQGGMEQYPQDYVQQGQSPQGYQSYGGGVDSGAYGGYEQYQPYQESISSDVITEISEQVVSDKLAQIRDNIEKTLDFRNSAETKLESLDDRLKKMEAIINRLQLSVLQKIGDYVNDVQDLKKELIETQKSFKAVHKKR